jgi:hypothetical protein
MTKSFAQQENIVTWHLDSQRSAHHMPPYDYPFEKERAQRSCLCALQQLNARPLHRAKATRWQRGGVGCHSQSSLHIQWALFQVIYGKVRRFISLGRYQTRRVRARYTLLQVGSPCPQSRGLLHHQRRRRLTDSSKLPVLYDRWGIEPATRSETKTKRNDDLKVTKPED